MMQKQPLVVIMGPTASGKSSLAIKIARHFSGEIVSADSMQVYKGLDVGTAKPGKKEKGLVPHHLIDVLDINDRLDVYLYVQMAENAIQDIIRKKKLPILAGGSGMYIRALLYGLDPLPSDPALRMRLEREYGGPENIKKLQEHMKGMDPESLERWKKHPRKLLRALEVILLTDHSIANLQTTWKGKLRYNVTSWNLCWDRKVLKKRIEKRTDKMLKSGWIEETRNLIKQGLLKSPTARQSLGYMMIADHLENRIDYETMRNKIVTATWQLARRQETWFRNQHPEAIQLQMPVKIKNLFDRISEYLISKK